MSSGPHLEKLQSAHLGDPGYNLQAQKTGTELLVCYRWIKLVLVTQEECAGSMT